MSEITTLLNRCKGLVDSLSGFGSTILAAGTLASESMGFIDTLSKRLTAWSTVAVFLTIACWETKGEREVVSPIVNANDKPETRRVPHASRYIWRIALVAVLTVLICDVYFVFYGRSAIASIGGPYFNAVRSQGAVDARFQKLVSKVEMPRLETLIAGEYGRDVAREMTIGDARLLYVTPLGEHFGFDIRKNDRVDSLIIEDVEVKVLAFIDIPPVPAAGIDRSDNNNIIVVEMEKNDVEELPWTFPAKFLLDDEVTMKAIEWGRRKPQIIDSLQRRFFVKVSARDAGIYKYTVDIILRPDFGHTVRVPIVTEPRTCVFNGGKFEPIRPNTSTPGKAQAQKAPVSAPMPQVPSLPQTPKT